jgi:hypothetical protein
MESIDMIYPVTQVEKNVSEIACWLLAAEAEIAAYHRVVHQLYGEDLAGWAVADWLESLDAMSWPPYDDGVWRTLTIGSVLRLSARIGPTKEIKSVLHHSIA